ncbi:hypothetical protein HKD24_04105 [Gluconobacter sp. LMG 31484]|uniref:Uncharacterized protein n=1 Tax=Gluconobacter vitians TaxID=2728102 RepID=A0ABR9Y398_9PROT|nr:hypothetical protein [Gluconobacter vitians]MBF0858399.1 hypothetical protein [Gluconobacter vitians]
MENCGFGWQNYLLSATLTGNGVSSLPVSNLQNQQGAASLAWRITGEGSGWSADFTARFPSVLPIRVISLHRTNLSSKALWRIQVHNDTTVVFDQNMPCHVSNGQCLFVLPAEVAGNTVEITVWNVSNPDGFISLPLAYVGPLWQPQRNYASSSTESLTLGQQSTTMLNGAEFVDARYVQRGLSIVHESYGDADVTVLRQIQQAAASGQNILFLPDPSQAPADLASQAVFGRLAGGDLSNPYGPTDRHAQTFTLTERL